MPRDIKQKISYLIEDQLPAFIQENNPGFVDFLEAYYEWLEKEDNPYTTPVGLLATKDVDTTADSFLTYFKNEFLKNFPKKLAVDKNGNTLDERRVLKNIREFYSAKGSEKAYRLLFRIIYNSTVEFDYPKNYILYPSDGKWIENKSLKVSSNNGKKLFQIKKKEIFQYDENNNIIARAIVDEVLKYDSGPYSVTELQLSQIQGTFDSKYSVTFNLDEGISFTERIYKVVSDLQITGQPGFNFAIGDVITIGLKARGASGTSFRAVVSEVNSTGGIKNVRIENSGVDYNAREETIEELYYLVYDVQRGGKILDSENIKIITNELSETPGYFKTNDGFVSSTEKLQDNQRYQEFSYVLKTEYNLNVYRKILKKLIHPIGYEMFGDVLLYRKNSVIRDNTSELHLLETPLIGNYLPYTFKTKENLRGAGTDVGTIGLGTDRTNFADTWETPNLGPGIDLYPNGFNPYNNTDHPGYGVSTHNRNWSSDAPFDSQLVTDATDYNQDIGTDETVGNNSDYSPGSDHIHHPGTMQDGTNALLGSNNPGSDWGPGETDYLGDRKHIGPIRDGVHNINYAHLPNVSDKDKINTYWVVFPHPNVRGIKGIPHNTAFKDIVIRHFNEMRIKVEKDVTKPYDLSSKV
tara:strand:+ start:157 stop:2064 length:1908 start_codon:yes stop_codon:yes gene_type:complete